MKRTITIKTRMEKQDYRCFLLDNTYRISWSYTLSILIGMAVVLSLLLRRMLGLDWLITAAIGMGAFVLLLVLQRVWLELQYRIETHEDRLRQFGRLQTLHFNEHAISIQAEGVDAVGTIGYDRLLRVIETRGYYYLYFARKTAAILPKRDPQAEERQQLSHLLAEKLAPYYYCVNGK